MSLTREPDPPRRAGPLKALLEGLLRRDPGERMAAEEATAMLVEFLRRQGIPAAPPGRRAADTSPGAFTL
jgi:hypothetical protein